MMLQHFSRKWLRKEFLLWWTLLGVVVGIGLGVGLYKLNCSALTIELIGYPGELLIRALQELVLPLIVLALMSGVFSLRSTNDGTARITRWSLVYYLLSMLLAVGLGIGLVYSIKPGNGAPFGQSGISSCSSANSTSSSADNSTVESLLNIGRNVIPTNIVSAAASSNFLGVITFSIVFAFTINTLAFFDRCWGFSKCKTARKWSRTLSRGSILYCYTSCNTEMSLEQDFITLELIFLSRQISATQGENFDLFFGGFLFCFLLQIRLPNLVGEACQVWSDSSFGVLSYHHFESPTCHKLTRGNGQGRENLGLL